MSAYPQISSEGAETVASIIKKVAEVPELLGDVKVIKRTIIRSNSIVKVKCKANIEFETEVKSVIFQPLIDPQVDETLEFKESCKTIRKGRSPNVYIYITNPSSCKIVLRRGDILGTLHNISAVIPIPIIKGLDINEISQEVRPEKENWQSEVELSDLTQEQQARVRKLLLEECDVFSKNPSNIGDISDFQMEIKLSDQIHMRKLKTTLMI